MLCRIRDGINYLGPGVKHRDDKFLSSFVLRFFFIVIPAQAGIHCPAGICVAYATALLITGLLRYARNDKKMSVLAHRTLMTWVPWSASTHEN